MEAKSFDDAWDLAEPVGGWLSYHEAAALYNAALNTPEDGLILEVGAFRGKTTTLLAASGRQVVTIDPLAVGFGDGEGYVVTEEDVAALRAVEQHWPNVTWLRGTAADFSGSHPIAMLFIDGDHSEGAPLRDFLALEPKLAADAIVAFHDYGDRPAVGDAVGQLERAGHLAQIAAAGLLYVGRIGKHPAKVARGFLGRPYYAAIEPESADSEHKAILAGDRMTLRIRRHRNSLLAHNFNDLLVSAINSGGYDFWALLHADVAPGDRWLARLREIALAHSFDVLHVVAPITNNEGLSSTAVAYSTNPWDTVRRLTMTELADLPLTFDIGDVRRQLGADAVALLPNTGCLLVRMNERVAKEFPGFEIRSRISRYGDRAIAEVVPEDWNFGFWCHEKGLAMGATREVSLRHLGQQWFPNDDVWGMPVDQHWLAERSRATNSEKREAA